MNRYLLIFLLCMYWINSSFSKTVSVGSKTFPESIILGELVFQVLEKFPEIKAQKKLGLGGTGIVFQALKEQEIDIYAEYTGTLKQAIYKETHIRDSEKLKKILKEDQLLVSKPIGFNNTYALAVRSQFAKKFNLRTISDLNRVANLKYGFSYEFTKREDGLPGLKKYYGLNDKNLTSMEHNLLYQALAEKNVDVIEVYSTDAKIKKYDLTLLEDNKKFFPQYLAVLLAHKNFTESFPHIWVALQKALVGRIDNLSMIELNSKVVLEGQSYKDVAKSFLTGKEVLSKKKGLWSLLWPLTAQHLKLVFVSLFFTIAFGVPLGVIATKRKVLGQFVLSISGLLQTIPALALLCFLIPLMGIGEKPAYFALFLYGLLPIVRNTYVGVSTVDKNLKEVSRLMGLGPFQQLIHLELPMASAAILAGIKTSAIINVGTATLAAFIGAGGLGTLIVTGLSLNDNEIILKGAIPAAVLAILLHFIFEVSDRLIIPKGLRLK